MTVYIKTNPKGIDKRLVVFQNVLNSIGWTNTDVYGRLYIVDHGEHKTAETYISSGDYKEIFLDDTKTSVFGFIVGDSLSSGISGISVPVKLICSCNLDTLHGSSERKDEETMLTVLKAISSLLPVTEEKTINKNMADVFSEISHERFKFRDIHPWFNFSISFNLSYSNNNC